MTKIVSVKFPHNNSYGRTVNSKTYAYSTDVEDIEVGDTVVVESPSSGYTCVKVVGIDDSPVAVSKSTKWVVCKVDDTNYKDRLEREKQKGVLIAKLQKLQKEVMERNQFEELAKLDPEAAKLVEELKNL